MKFRRKIVTLALSVGAMAPAAASEFCDDYKQGFVTGYKQAAQTSLAPLTPLWPLKPLKGFGDPESDFEFGYTIGDEIVSEKQWGNGLRRFDASEVPTVDRWVKRSARSVA